MVRVDPNPPYFPPRHHASLTARCAPSEVRNEDSRARLPPALRICLVLTVEEAQGLEFDDAEQWSWSGCVLKLGFERCK